MSYQKKIIELIKNDISNNEIQKIIYDLYKIRIGIDKINSDRRKYGDKRNFENKIRTIVKESLFSLTLKDIKDYLISNYGVFKGESDISKIIWDTNLKNEFTYDKLEKTYSNRSTNSIKEINSTLINEPPKDDITYNINSEITKKISSDTKETVFEDIFQKIKDFRENYRTEISQNSEEIEFENILKIIIPKHIKEKISFKNMALFDYSVITLSIVIREILEDIELVLECITKNENVASSQFENILIRDFDVSPNQSKYFKSLLESLDFIVIQKSIYYSIADYNELEKFKKKVSNNIFIYSSIVENYSEEKSEFRDVSNPCIDPNGDPQSNILDETKNNTSETNLHFNQVDAVHKATNLKENNNGKKEQNKISSNNNEEHIIADNDLQKIVADLHDNLGKLNQILKNQNRSNQLNFNKEVIELSTLYKIISEEKLRIGKSDANLLAENINFRLKNKLWD